MPRNARTLAFRRRPIAARRRGQAAAQYVVIHREHTSRTDTGGEPLRLVFIYTPPARHPRPSHDRDPNLAEKGNKQWRD